MAVKPNRLLVGIVVSALALAMGGIAFAQEREDDTVFNFGYDEENQVFVWNTSGVEGLHDCTLENGTLTTTYGALIDGVIPVENLEDEDGEVFSFRARTADELPDDVDPADDPIDYSGADGECVLIGAEVAGPQGQVNHGMFMKLFNSLYEGRGRGCVVRHLAQSDLGKGDQQVRVPDVDADFESVTEGDTGEISFSTILTACERGNGNGNGGRPPWAGPPWLREGVDSEGWQPGTGGPPPWAGGGKGNGKGNGNGNGNGE